MPDCPVIILIGRRRSGKSVNCMSILKHLSTKCKWGLAFVGSNASIRDYAKVMPSSYIYDELDLDLLDRVFERQDRAAQKGTPEKIFILIDDLAYNASLFQTKQVRRAFMNGRHLGITLIITLQYALLLPPSARGNSDLIFASQEKSSIYRRKLYDNFSIVFKNFREFDRVYTSCTKNFSTFVMVNCSGNPSDRIEDNVHYFKSEYPLPSFKMNPSGRWWALHKKRNDPTGSFGTKGEIKMVSLKDTRKKVEDVPEFEEKKIITKIETPARKSRFTIRNSEKIRCRVSSRFS